MDKKEPIKIKLSICIVLIVVLILAVVGGMYFIMNRKIEKNDKIPEDIGSYINLNLGKYTVDNILGIDENSNYECGITLQENNKFDFYMGWGADLTGIYEIKNNLLICNVDTRTDEFAQDRKTNIVINFDIIDNNKLKLINIEINDANTEKLIYSDGLKVGMTYSLKLSENENNKNDDTDENLGTFKFETAYGTVKIDADNALAARGTSGASNTIFYLKDNKLYLYVRNSTDELYANGVKNIYYEFEETEKITVELDLNSTFSKESTYIYYKNKNSSEVNTVSSNWKKVYKNKLQFFYSENSVNAETGINNTIEYMLFDMDKDNIPELLIESSTCEADRILYVYTFKNNEIKELGTIISGHMGFYKMNNENYILGVSGHMGYESVYKIYLDISGNIKKELISEREVEEKENYKEGDILLEKIPYNETYLIDNY